MAQERRAIVAGAGVAGLCTAIALAGEGWSLDVLERAALLEDVGAGIQIPPNASKILRAWGVLEALSRRALAPEAIRMRRAGDGRDIVRVPLGPVAELRWGAPYLVAHRADLIGALAERAAHEPAIHLEMRAQVVGVALSEEGVQVALRQDGQASRREADLLIGADGLRSIVRRGLGLGAADRPIWSGRTAWRALVEARRAPAHALRLETCVWLGKHAHLVHYPVRGGELINLVCVVDDGWRGTEDVDIWSARGEARDLLRFFRRWNRDAQDLVEAAQEWRRWPLYDRHLAVRWTENRVALAGDAAHPMMPFLAQGAAQSVEDASILASALARSQNDVARGLAAYARERMPRAAAVQLASRRQGVIYHLSGPAAVARDLVIERIGFEGLMRRLDWLYQGPTLTDAGRR